MTLTYSEVLKKYGSRYKLRKALERGELVRRSRGLYEMADNPGTFFSDVSVRYPNAILSGKTALYLYGLIDMPPETIDVASASGSTKIALSGVHQTFAKPDAVEIGKTQMSADGVEVSVYDEERMLLELMRIRNKIPHDLYREAVQSFRRRAEKLDIYKLQNYAELLPRGMSYLDRAMAEVF